MSDKKELNDVEVVSDNTKITAIGHWILIEVKDKKDLSKTTSGLYISNDDVRMVRGAIVGFGQLAYKDGLEVGDEIVCPMEGVLTTSLYSKKYAFVNYNNILGIENNA